MKRRALVLLCAVAAYATYFAPSSRLRDGVRTLCGCPAYAGPWLALEHLLLDSTLTALSCATVWTLLARAGWMPPLADTLRLARPRRILFWGVVGGLSALAAGIGMMAIAAPEELGYIPPSGWKILGNLFSNFYEELIYRAFLVTALEVALGSFWAAAALSSFAFGYAHAQYPVPLRALIGASGLLWCWTRRRTGSLWTPYLSHELLDVIGDSLVR